MLRAVRSVPPATLSRCCCKCRIGSPTVHPLAAAVLAHRHASTHHEHQVQPRKRRRGGRRSLRQTSSTTPQLPSRPDVRVGGNTANQVISEGVRERWTPGRQGVVSMAPFVPTPSLGVSAALRLLAMSAQRGDVFVDLGCGDGRLVAAA
jgi:methylase of polypeptide subunit release factors